MPSADVKPVFTLVSSCLGFLNAILHQLPEPQLEMEVNMPIGFILVPAIVLLVVFILRRVGPPGGDTPHKPAPCCTVREPSQRR